VPPHVSAAATRSDDSSRRAARGLRKQVGFALLGATCVNLQKSVSLATLGAACAALMFGVHASPATGIESWLDRPSEPRIAQVSSWAPEEQPQDPLSKLVFPSLPG